jgi:hypothetical protein
MKFIGNPQLSALLLCTSLFAVSHPLYGRDPEAHHTKTEIRAESPTSPTALGPKIDDLDRLNLSNIDEAESFALDTVREYKENYGHLDRSLQPPIFIYHIADESRDLPEQIKWILVYLESHKIPYQVSLTTPEQIHDQLQETMNEASSQEADKLQLSYSNLNEDDIKERKSMLHRAMTNLRRFFWIPKNVTFWLKAHPPKWTKFVESFLKKGEPTVGPDEKTEVPIWTEANLKEQDAAKLKAYVAFTTAAGMFNVTMSIVNNPDTFLANPSPEGFALGLMLVGARTYFTSTHNLWFDRIFTLGKDVRIAGDGQLTAGLSGKTLKDKFAALGTKDFYSRAKSEFLKKTIIVESHWRWNWLSNSFDNMIFNFFYFWSLYGISVTTDPIYLQHAATNTLWYLLGRSWIDRKIVQKQATIHHNGDVELKPGQHTAGFTLLIKFVTKSIFGFFKTFDLMKPKSDTRMDGTDSNYKLASQIYRLSAGIGLINIIYDHRFWVMNKFKTVSNWWSDVETPVSTCTTYLIRPRAHDVQQELFHK